MSSGEDRLTFSTGSAVDAAIFRNLLDQLFHAQPITLETPGHVVMLLKSLSDHTYRDGKQGIMDARAVLAKRLRPK